MGDLLLFPIDKVIEKNKRHSRLVMSIRLALTDLVDKRKKLIILRSYIDKNKLRLIKNESFKSRKK